MPILRRAHSSVSAAPVTKPMSGMSPSALVRGIRICGIPAAGSAVFTHGATLGMTNCRRHRPFWMTRGMFAPAGTLVIVKLPSVPVTALTRGAPVTMALQSPQLTPGVKGCTGAFGT